MSELIIDAIAHDRMRYTTGDSRYQAYGAGFCDALLAAFLAPEWAAALRESEFAEWEAIGTPREEIEATIRLLIARHPMTGARPIKAHAERPPGPSDPPNVPGPKPVG